MINYKDLGLKSFKNGMFKEAKTYFSLAFTQENKEEILFLISLSEAAIKNPDDANLIFEFFSMNSDLKDDKNFDDFNKLLSTIESSNNDLKNSEITTKEDAISYEEFKDLILKNKDFKQSLESVMLSTKLIIKTKDSFLDFIDDLFKNGMQQLANRYFEMFVEIHGSWDKKTQDIAKKIKEYEDRANK